MCRCKQRDDCACRKQSGNRQRLSSLPRSGSHSWIIKTTLKRKTVGITCLARYVKTLMSGCDLIPAMSLFQARCQLPELLQYWCDQTAVSWSLSITYSQLALFSRSAESVYLYVRMALMDSVSTRKRNMNAEIHSRSSTANITTCFFPC